MILLHLETAASVCSVALARDGQLLALRESDEKNAHSKVITLFVQEVMSSAGIMLEELDAVAVSEGPGSYTGLRIGVATAKGLCYSLDKPLIAVPTLESMAGGMAELAKDLKTGLPVLLCPMLDARRMEVYSALFSADGKIFRETRAEIIDEHSYEEYREKYHLLLAGEGAEKCRPVLDHHQNITFLQNYRISAASLIPLALQRYHEGRFENNAYFEPFYLKDFVAAKPVVKGLK